jgi:hypothetical protein
MHMYLIFIGLQPSLKKKQHYQLGITNCAWKNCNNFEKNCDIGALCVIFII